MFTRIVDQIIKTIEEDSDNSVSKTMYKISWNDTIYRTFNEGVRLSWKYGCEDSLPYSLIEYTHNAHVSLILILLRKLYERKQIERKSVNSIPTLYDKIMQSVSLFTRENYVCRGGYPYKEHPENNASTWKINAVLKHRHILFDKFCGVDNSADRKKDDRLSIKIIEKLKTSNVLDDDIEVFANKFLAHASSENNRPIEEYVYGKMTLHKVDNQIKKAIWGLQQIGKLIDHLILTTVATPQFNPIKNWSGSIFNEKIESQLRKYWDKRMAWWEKWFRYYWMGDELFITPRKSI
jgi:hypothetical protein